MEMDYDFKTLPRRHQAREFLMHKDSKARALIWHMRTGKTKAMIDLACYLFKQGRIDGVLVVAPNNVHLNWLRRELPKHHWDSVPYRAMAWSAQEARADRKAWDLRFYHFLQPGPAPDLAWYTMNVEGFAHANAKSALGCFLRQRKRFLLIVDEVHEFRGFKSTRAKNLRLVAKHASVRRILSANPLDNSPLHAFSEFELLQTKALGYEKYEDFEERYAVKEEIYVPGGRGRDGSKRPARRTLAVTGHRNLEELRDRVARWTSLVTRDECDDMPELMQGSTVFELSDAQKRAYNALVTGALARMDSGEIIPPVEGGVLVIRLQQIASGYAIGEDGEVMPLVDDDRNPRLQALYNEVLLLPGKFVVWCRFREDIVRVAAYLNAKGIQVGDYYGGTPKRKRAEYEDRLREDPSLRGIVGQPQAGGQGLDFSEAQDILWYSHTSDLLRRRQADERATKVGGRRIGLTDLIAAGTVDEKLLEDLEAKAVTSGFMTGDGLRRYLEVIK